MQGKRIQASFMCKTISKFAKALNFKHDRDRCFCNVPKPLPLLSPSGLAPSPLQKCRVMDNPAKSESGKMLKR